MYNRYVRGEQGGHVRVPQPDQAEDSSRADTSRHTAPPESPGSAARGDAEQRERRQARNDGLTGILRHALDQLHLESVDTGDLLLLALLFLLFREEADEELLVALGLLLIL